ncbi:hypothetical protein CRUP_035889, partial [Coryphaenoides rupestris]
MQRMSDMLSRWFEEASEAQGSRGGRPQARTRGTAIHPEMGSSTPGAPSEAASTQQGPSTSETPAQVEAAAPQGEAEACPAPPQPTSTSSSSSSGETSGAAQPSSSSLASSLDSEQRRSQEAAPAGAPTPTPTTTPTPTSTPTPTLPRHPPPQAQLAPLPPQTRPQATRLVSSECIAAAGGSGTSSSTSTCPPGPAPGRASTAEPVLSLHYSSEGTTTSTIKLDFTEWSSRPPSSRGSGGSKSSIPATVDTRPSRSVDSSRASLSVESPAVEA